jgi:glutamyl-tRNA synthetase
MLNAERLKQLVPLVQERAERLSDLVPMLDYLVGERRALSIEDFQHKSLERAQVVRVLYHTIAAFEEMRSWQRDDIYNTLQSLAVACDMKVRDFLFPLFIAVSGRSVSLPLFDSLVFLGAPLSLGRLRDALDVLSVSGKERKRLDKEYQKLQFGQD